MSVLYYVVSICAVIWVRVFVCACVCARVCKNVCVCDCVLCQRSAVVQRGRLIPPPFKNIRGCEKL